MNDEKHDPELRAVAAEWSAPPPSTDLRARVMGAYHREFGKVPWWRRGLRGRSMAGFALAACVLLLVVAEVFPQMRGAASPPAKVPWTVDSQFVEYAADGSSSIEMYTTSYESNSVEILLARSLPGNVFLTAMGRVADVALPAWSRFITPFVVDAETLEKVKRARASRSTIGFLTGCSADCMALEHYGFAKAPEGSGASCIAGMIVGRETILNHVTEAVRQRWTEHGRMTLWMAPDLGCFALRVTHELELPDGTFHLVKAKRAMKVNVYPKGLDATRFCTVS